MAPSAMRSEPQTIAVCPESMSSQRRRLAALDREQRGDDVRRRRPSTPRWRSRLSANPTRLRRGRDEAVRADRQADRAVPERDQVPDGEVQRGGVVGRDRRGVDALGEAVDQHDRHAAAAQAVVALVAGGVSACRPETKTMPSTAWSSSISTYSSSVVPPGDWVHSSGV